MTKFTKTLVVTLLFVLAFTCTVYAKKKEDYDYAIDYCEIVEEGGVVTVRWSKPADSTSYKILTTFVSEKTGNEKRLTSRETTYNVTSYIISDLIAGKGLGSYYVEVRPTKNKEGAATSDELEVDAQMLTRIQEYVSTGMTTAQSNAADKWVQTNGIWHLYRNGAPVVNDWAPYNGNWYLFDAAGNMLKGWQKRGKYWYYMEQTGNSKYPEGACYINDDTPDGYHVNERGEWVTNY